MVPKVVNAFTEKWVFAWNIDFDGYITKAKARLVARGFGQQSGVVYFNMFASTPTVPFIKLVLAIALQNDRSLYHFDVKQAFVQAKLDTDVYIKLPCCCGERTGEVIKLDCALYGINQTGRQWSTVLCQTYEDEHGMEQCRTDSCVYRKIVEGVVEMILVVNADDILVSGKKEARDELHQTVNENVPN